MEDVFEKFGLNKNVIDFLGHAVAMHFNDSYLKQKAKITIEKMKTYG